jgi:hypothetical protein
MLRTLLILPLIFLMGCTIGQERKPVGPLKITQEVWDNYQIYLHDLGTRNLGAYAVSLDGEKYYVVWCDGTSCGGPTYRREAVKGCERNGRQCVLFAYLDEILVEYEIVK